MRIVRYDADGTPAWGVLDGDTVRATQGRPFVDLRAGEVVGPVAGLTLLAPVDPRVIMCVGRNYVAHAEEFGNQPPERPLLFMKPPTSVIGPDAAIVHPQLSERVDPEGELVVVIGEHAHGVAREDAWKVVGGYTLGNDVTARDLQKSDPGGQWTRGKGFATFCPIGPWIETDFDPTDVELTCRVGDEVRQRGRTSAFIFDIPTLIEYITAFVRLEPGDLIMTGTPEGVRPVAIGDVVTVAAAGLGELRNPVVAPR